MADRKRNSSILSILITVVVIVGGVWLFANREKFSDDNHYHVFFTDVEGLTIASQVSINGAVVGRVSDIQLMPPSVRVTVAVGKEVFIPVGTTAKLASAGMSGGEEIRLIPGTGKNPINDEGTITGVNSKSLLGQDGKIGATLHVARVALKTTDSIIDNISALFTVAETQDIRFKLNKMHNQSNDASKKAIEIKGTGEKFAGKIAEINKDAAKLANDSKEWPKAIADAEKQSADLVASTANIEEDFKTLQTNLKKLKSISDKVEDKNGALGKLFNDKQQYHTISRSTDTLNRSVKDMMAHPSSHWFAIFGKNK